MLHHTRTCTRLLFCLFILACQGRNPEQQADQEETSAGQDSSDREDAPPLLKEEDLRIVPTMASAFDEGNAVHCSNAEYLWDALRGHTDRDLSHHVLANEFNQSKTWKNTLDTNRLILACGKPDEVYKRIVQQYITKYNINMHDLEKRGGTFWGYTDKRIALRYEEPFPEQKMTFSGVPVSAFGFDSKPGSELIKDFLKSQFAILYYNADGEFVVKLKPSNARDEIVLAMLKDRSTFLQMFNRTEGLIRQGKDNIKKDALVNHFNAEDELIIPAIKFRVLQHYAALEGLTFSSNYGEIDSFDQSIDFNFDRHGVIMESTAGMVDSVGMPQKPKLLYFNKPFYLYIKEAGAPYPYFNLWIADPKILEKQKI